jgi:hypothetical protein
MKKVIFGLLAAIVLAVGGGIYYGLSNLDALVKAAIEKYGSEATQTAVRVDKVKIKLTEGDGAIYGLTVANPGGFTQKQAFSLGEVGLGIDLQSLKEEPYVINHITVRAPKVNVEINKDNKTNLNELKKNLGGGKTASKGTAQSSQSAGKEPRLIIKKLTFEKGAIAAKVTPLKKDYDLKLPPINMANLGGSKGATPTELTKEIIKRLTDAAMAEIKKKGIDAELDKIKAKAQKKVDEEKAKIKAKADSKIEAEKRKAEEKLKGLFR